ncbi:MAG: hypothetical protein P4L83_05615 [Nevskia sp.]|nr:hypothetical protein [Nevskia sp.]
MAWKKEFIYAPNETMWLSIAKPWEGSLSDFHGRMKARLERVERQRSHYESDVQHQDVVSDTRGLV